MIRIIATKICNFLLILLLSTVIISPIIYAEPNVETVSVNPETPSKLSDVTITASFTGINESDDITIYIKECDENTGLCDQPFSVEMMRTNSDNFSADFSLNFDTATYFDYWFVVESNGESTDIKKDDPYKVQLASSSGDGNDPQDVEDSKGVPGFEMTIFLVAIFMGLIYLTKRDRR